MKKERVVLKESLMTNSIVDYIKKSTKKTQFSIKKLGLPRNINDSVVNH